MTNRPTFSLSEAADLLGISRSTLERALRAGAPAVQRADRSKRRPWLLHIGDLMEWFLGADRQRIIERATGPKADTARAIASRMHSRAIIAAIEADERSRSVVSREWAERRLTDEMADLRACLLSVPASVAAPIAMEASPAVIQRMLLQAIRDAVDRHLKGPNG